MNQKLALILVSKIAAWSQVCGPFGDKGMPKYSADYTFASCSRVCPDENIRYTGGYHSAEMMKSAKCLRCLADESEKIERTKLKYLSDVQKCQDLEKEAVEAFRNIK